MAFELVVTGIHHQYGSLSVLEDVSFTIAQGEILAIVGPSGCGKSTLLGILGVLLMDEPFSALDAQTRDLLMDDFEAIWAREHTTAAYVTHNLAEALRMADRIMILRRRPGRIRQMFAVPIPRAERNAPAARTEL